jgi:hypothetical protein
MSPDFILRTNSHFKTPGPPAVVAGSEKELVSWYNARVKELEVLRRSAVINRIYEGPRLVVEKDVEEIQVSSTPIGRGRLRANGS